MRKCTEKSLNSESSAETDIDYIYYSPYKSNPISLTCKTGNTTYILSHYETKNPVYFHKTCYRSYCNFTKLFCFIVTLSSISSQKTLKIIVKMYK